MCKQNMEEKTGLFFFFLNHQDAKYSTIAGHVLPSSSGSRYFSLSFSIFSLSFSNLSIFALEIPIHKTNIGKAFFSLSKFCKDMTGKTTKLF